MKWMQLTGNKFRSTYTALVEMYPMPDGPANFILGEKDHGYREIRDKLLSIEKIALEASQGTDKKTYAYDLEFGLRMYEYLQGLGFGVWQAADNGVWAYLSMKVIPDIVFRRWKKYNEDRFYKRNWRLWLKCIWWYVYLSEDGNSPSFDLPATRELLADNSEDILYLLLDHPGHGFRDTVYHELMRHYHDVVKSGKIGDSREDFFRSIMLQHQIRSVVVDPILESEKDYVDALFQIVERNFIRG